MGSNGDEETTEKDFEFFNQQLTRYKAKKHPFWYNRIAKTSYQRKECFLYYLKTLMKILELKLY